MIRVGPGNAITDVPGLAVGSAADHGICSGVTVILPDARAVVAVDAQGGGTGTRELELLGTDATVDAVDAVVLGGGGRCGGSTASDAVHPRSDQSSRRGNGDRGEFR